ncbi:hypothetical protein J4E83_000800 [Alternaria metachromatica]|uniref:uncharacterized protein n=1 Tax=Alternaria metachromatica TaxID=283354 RepID=UPI0020C1F45F|nr:uncharacterized protein J4E83_000800 [Alternaria metachromatica]KAI4637979.1 hypothetical protein J4E83_000800 [Alternaria metachromatica]
MNHFFTRSKGSAPTEPIDPELWVIIYPEKLPKEGNVPDEKKINALTNLPSLKTWVLEDLKRADVPGWEVINAGRITYKEAEARYRIDDGDPVEIPKGREWDSDGNGRWATYGGTSTYAESRKNL